MSTTGRRPEGRGGRLPVSGYDLLLALLPLPLLAGFVGGGEVGRWVGALTSLALLAHALFVAPPGGSTGRSG